VIFVSDPFTDLLELAEAAFAAVAADPATHGAATTELVARARVQGSPEALVVALRAQAEAERLAPRNTAAKALLDEALAVAEQHGLQQRVGELLVTRLAVNQELGDLDAAQADAERAGRLLPADQATDLRMQHGVLMANRGRLKDAATMLRSVVEDERTPTLVLAKAGNNLAHVECELGHVDEALRVLTTAESVAHVAGPSVVAYVAQTRARVEAEAGRLAESLVRFEVAEQRLREAGLWVGGVHIEYAQALSGLRLLPEAVASVRRGLAGLPEEEVALVAAEGYVVLARLMLMSGRPDEAVQAVRRGAQQMRAQDRQGWSALADVLAVEAALDQGGADDALLAVALQAATDLESCGLRTDAVEAHLVAGRVGRAAGRDDRADLSLGLAVELSRSAPVLVRLRGWVAQALRGQLRGQQDAVLVACRDGMADLDAYRQALPSIELRALASAHGAELGTIGLRALLALRTPAAEVFDWLERTRAAALAPLESVPDAVVEGELVALRSAHALLSAQRSTDGSEPPDLVLQVRSAEEAVRRASWSPVGADVARVSRVEGSVQEGLGQAVLVEYGMSEGALLAVLVTPGGERLVALGAVAPVVGAVDALQFAIRRLSRPAASPAAAGAAIQSARAALGRLRDLLVVPLGLEAGPVVVVPVGDLQRVTWAPLHDGPVTVSPSAAAWLRTLEPRAGTGRVTLVGGADLPGAAAELAALAVVHDGPVVLPEATCDAAVEALCGADLAHFACHGRLRTDNPAFSALLLADGPLTVHELSRRAGTPGRVVLAACESGAQVLYPGDEALGFVSALLARGCRAVLASDVLVPDEPSLPLMVALHRALTRGATMAQALHEARQVLDTDDPQQLATWCAFDAYGGG
jgi:tetratricopeptide (TPR) repeat protein